MQGPAVHPIIDCDGHIREFMPGVMPYLRETLGQAKFDSFLETGSALTNSYGGGETARRMRTRAPQGAWWASPSRNTLDRTTTQNPRLLYDRLDELGMDYVILYPTLAFGTCGSRTTRCATDSSTAPTHSSPMSTTGRTRSTDRQVG